MWQIQLLHVGVWELYGITCIMIRTESYGTCWAAHEQLWRLTTDTTTYDGWNESMKERNHSLNDFTARLRLM
jgi:hypothetical protein